MDKVNVINAWALAAAFSGVAFWKENQKTKKEFAEFNRLLQEAIAQQDHSKLKGLRAKQKELNSRADNLEKWNSKLERYDLTMPPNARKPKTTKKRAKTFSATVPYVPPTIILEVAKADLLFHTAWPSGSVQVNPWMQYVVYSQSLLRDFASFDGH